MALIGGGSSLGGIQGSSNVSRLLVVLSGDSAPLTAALAKAEGSLAGFQANAGTIGSALTRSLSLPLLALGGYAIKAATDFQTAIGRVAGLTPFLDQAGLSVQGLSNVLLKMASDPQIVATPTDLANALYYAGSAGLTASEALQTVELSAKGASVGMGEATDISRVLIAALNNYRSSGLTAANAMDILTVAIKDGTAAPDEMAVALGRLLPIAAIAKISFAQVTASVAALTNLGVPTRVATTSLRALFSELLVPTAAATAKLNELGISVQQLTSALTVGGPVAAFQLLQQATNNNIQSLHAIIPQIRGFTAYAGLSGDQLKAYTKIIYDTTHATGQFQKALDIISKTPAFQFQKGLQELQVAAISIGEKLVPVFVRLSKVLQDVGNIIAGLPGPMQDFVAGFIVLGAVIGPLIKLYAVFSELGGVVASGGALMANFTTIAKGLAVGLAAVGISAGVAVGSFESIIHNGAGLISTMGLLVGSIVAVTLALKGLQTIALTGALGAGAISEAFVSLGSVALPVAAAVGLIATAVALTISKSRELQRNAADMGAALLSGAQSGETLATALAAIKNTDIRDELLGIAHNLGLMKKNAADALVPLTKGIGQDIIKSFDDLASKSHQFNVALNAGGGVDKFREALTKAVDSGRDLGPILKQAGLEGSTLFSAISQSAGVDQGFAQQANDLGSLILQYGNAIQAYKDYQTTEQGAIASSLANTQAIKGLAEQYGVSTQTIQGWADKFGVTVGGMSSATKNAFISAATGIKGPVSSIQASTAAAAQASVTAAQTISDAMTGAFDIFAKLPAKVKPIDKVIAQIQQLGQVAVDEGANVKTLLERGVPSDLVSKFIAAGPNTVKQFADATSGQLKRVVNAYEAGLGAMDSKILQESAHQVVKGKNMVAGFATAILSSNHLVATAGTKIVQSVVAALDAGKVTPVGVKYIKEFVLGLGSGVSLSKAEGSKITQAFVDGIASGQFVDRSGILLVNKVVQGLHSSAGITITEAKALVGHITSGIAETSPQQLAAGNKVGGQIVAGLHQTDYRSVGSHISSQLAAGILSGQTAITGAAVTVGKNAKTAFDKAFKGSPMYFTYYMGIELIRQLGQGAEDQSQHQDFNTVGQNLAKAMSRSLGNYKGIENILSNLETLVTNNMKKIFDEADKEAVKGLEKTGNDLQNQLTKIQTSFKNFKQGIVSGFSGYKDLFSGVTQLFADFASKNQAALDQQKSLQDQISSAGPGTDTSATQQQLAALVIPPAVPSAGDITAYLQGQAQGAQQLAQGLQKLAAQGLNQGLLTQLAAQGSSALPIIAALEQSPELIKEFNDAEREINKVTKQTADRLGERFFGKALNEAVDALHQFSLNVLKVMQALVVGLDGKNSDLAKAIQTMIQNLQNINQPNSQTGTGNPGNGGPNPSKNPVGLVPGPGGGGYFGGQEPTPPLTTGGWSGGGLFRSIPAPTTTQHVTIQNVNLPGVKDPASFVKQLQELVQRDARVNAGVSGFANR